MIDELLMGRRRRRRRERRESLFSPGRPQRTQPKREPTHALATTRTSSTSTTSDPTARARRANHKSKSKGAHNHPLLSSPARAELGLPPPQNPGGSSARVLRARTSVGLRRGKHAGRREGAFFRRRRRCRARIGGGGGASSHPSIPPTANHRPLHPSRPPKQNSYSAACRPWRRRP